MGLVWYSNLRKRVTIPVHRSNFVLFMYNTFFWCCTPFGIFFSFGSVLVVCVFFLVLVYYDNCVMCMLFGGRKKMKSSLTKYTYLCLVCSCWNHVLPPQEALLEMLYDIFLLVIPVATADFNEALISIGGYSYITLINPLVIYLFIYLFLSCSRSSIETTSLLDPSRFQDSWRLTDGFVASEAKKIVPYRSCSRWTPCVVINVILLCVMENFDNISKSNIIQINWNSFSVLGQTSWTTTWLWCFLPSSKVDC